MSLDERVAYQSRRGRLALREGERRERFCGMTLRLSAGTVFSDLCLDGRLDFLCAFVRVVVDTTSLLFFIEQASAPPHRQPLYPQVPCHGAGAEERGDDSAAGRGQGRVRFMDSFSSVSGRVACGGHPVLWLCGWQWRAGGVSSVCACALRVDEI